MINQNLRRSLALSEANYRRNLATALFNVRSSLTEECWIGRGRHALGMPLDCIIFREYPSTADCKKYEEIGLVDSGIFPNKDDHTRFWFITYKVIFKTDAEFHKAQKEGKI